MSFCDLINLAKVEVLILLKEILNGELKEAKRDSALSASWAEVRVSPSV